MSSRTARRRIVLALAGPLLLIGQTTLRAQAFYQLTNPRIYRVDPPTDNPWDHGYGFGGLAFRSIPGDPNGTILISWERDIVALAQGKRGDLAEVVIDFASSPNPQGTNDATLVSQVFDWGWCNSLDYDSDERVAVNARYEYSGSPRSPGSGIGRFLRQDGRIVGFEMTTPFAGFKLGEGEQHRFGFAGPREIAGTTYDTLAITKMATGTSGIFFLDVQTGDIIDADPTAPNGTLSGNPYIGFAGDTGVTNIASPVVSGRSLLVGLDVVGDTAFVLVSQDLTSIELMQLDLPSKRLLGVTNVSQMLDPSRGGHCTGYTQEMDVTAAGDGKVRILIADCTDRTLTSLSVIDGVAVPGLADLDSDADVDLADFLIFQDCFNGPNRAPKGVHCARSDLDGDGDADLGDFAVFQGCFNGPNRPAKC